MYVESLFTLWKGEWKGAYNINLFHISNIWQPLSPAADTISTRNLQSKRREAKRGHKESPEKKSYLQSHPHFFQPLAHWKIILYLVSTYLDTDYFLLNWRIVLPVRPKYEDWLFVRLSNFLHKFT